MYLVKSKDAEVAYNSKSAEATRGGDLARNL